MTRWIVILKITSSSLNQFSIAGTRKLSWIWMHTYNLIFEVMIAMSAGRLNDINCYQWNERCVFFKRIFLYASFKHQHTKFPASLPWPIPIRCSLVNITVHLLLFLSLGNVNLSFFFCLCVNAGFLLVYIYIYIYIYIYMVLCHIYSLTKVKSWKHTRI